MVRKVGIGFIFSLCSISSLSQERVIDLKEVYTVLDAWNDALNQKSLSALEGLYADEVIFYAKRLPKVSCLGIKSKRLQSPKYFHQKIIGKPAIKVYDTDIIRASFVKQVTSGTVVTNYDAYLLFKRIDGELSIVGESDLIADGKASFALDIGKELKTSLLSNSRMQVGATAESDNGQQVNVKGILSAVFVGGIVLITVIVFRRISRGGRRKDSPKATVQEIVATAQELEINERQEKSSSQPNELKIVDKGQKALDDGYAFEQFVFSRFNQQYFKCRDWTSDKSSAGVYAQSSMNPDMHFEFIFGEYSNHFAVECKYRKVLFNGKFELEQRQIKNYRRYSRERNMPVYIVLGVGGEPKAPNDLYVLPLDLFATTPIIGYQTIRNYYNNPEKNFFLDKMTGKLTWFRKPAE